MGEGREMRVKAWLWPVLGAGLLLMVVSIGLTPASARAATANVAISADPTEMKPLTVTVTGQAETGRFIWAFAFPEAAHKCDAASPRDLEDGKRILDYLPVQAGNFRESGAFTPPTPGQYRICVFVAADRWASPDARTSKSFTVRLAKATSRIDLSGEPITDAPVTVTVSGETEVDRYLTVAVFWGITSCDAYATDDWSGEHLTKMDWIPAGGYERTFTVVPPRNSRFRICSFVTDLYSTQENARGDVTIEPRPGRAQLKIVPAGVYRHLSPSYYAVNGTTEVAGALRSFIFYGHGPCPAKPRLDGPGESQWVGVGEFTQTDWRFVPRFAGPGRICAYVIGRGGTVVGIGSADVNVQRAPNFEPRLITPDGKVGFGRVPLLKWKYGPDMSHLDYFQIYRKRPKGPRPSVRGRKPTRGIYLDGRTTRSGGGKGRGVIWVRVIKRLAPGRYWWRVFRQDTETKYWEASRLGSIVVAPRR